MSILQDHAGFNITTSKLQIVEVNFEDDNLLLENVDEENFSKNFSSDVNNLENVDIFRQTFINILSRKPLYSKRVSFTLPDSFFRIANIPYESGLTDEDFNDHIDWELSVLFPAEDINEFAVQKIRMPVTQFSFTPSVLIYAVNKKLLKLIHQFCTENNLELNYIDNAHIASNSLINTVEGSEDLILSTYVFDNCISLILLKGSNPIYWSSSKLLNADLFTSALSSELEKLNELGLSLTQVSKFYIAGSNLENIDLQQIQSSNGIELTQIDPFANLKTAPSIVSGKFVNQLKGSFTAAAGIAFRLV
jgi:Tfp pilus assembly PilM family ATPase